MFKTVGSYQCRDDSNFLAAYLMLSGSYQGSAVEQDSVATRIAEIAITSLHAYTAAIAKVLLPWEEGDQDHKKEKA